jgi:hypothetical protein
LMVDTKAALRAVRKAVRLADPTVASRAGKMAAP